MSTRTGLDLKFGLCEVCYSELALINLQTHTKTPQHIYHHVQTVTTDNADTKLLPNMDDI